MASFVVKLSNDGIPIWAKSFGEIGGASVRDFFVDDRGRIYTTGSFTESVLKIGDFVFENKFESESIFLVCFDANGKELWAHVAVGAGRNTGRGVYSNAKGMVYSTGSFEQDHIVFGDYRLKNQGSADVFLVKFLE